MSDYAPEYTRRERIIFLVKHMLWFVPLLIATEFWFFDRLEEFSNQAHCYRYGNITGFHLLMYGMFVGIPLSSAVLIAALEGRRSLEVLRLGQNPLPGEKVFQRTKYQFGFKAKVKPIALFCFIGFFLLFSVWGAVQAYVITQEEIPCNDPLAVDSGFSPVVPQPPLEL